MATEIGPQDSDVKDPLEASFVSRQVIRPDTLDVEDPRYTALTALMKAEPWTFDFFRAVWLLERIRSGRRRVGFFHEPTREVVRFGVHQSLAFPASSIQSLDPEKPDWKMLVNFIGMTGPLGVLPRLYTVAVQDRMRVKDFTLRDFLDMFNHRATSLFYRAWTKYRLPVRYPIGMDDQMSLAFMSLVGLGTSGLGKRMEVEDETFVWFSGLFGLQTRSAVALEQILEDYFQVPADVVQFVGAWCPLVGDSTCTLTEDEDPSEQLGCGAVVGDEVFDHQARVRVRLGPLTIEQYRRFLPGESGYRRLRQLTRFFSRDQMDFEVQLVLRRDDVPYCHLADEPEEEQVQLGWTTWMKNHPSFTRNPDDTVLLLQ
jgi:type VI secretion system protein ImpH